MNQTQLPHTGVTLPVLLMGHAYLPHEDCPRIVQYAPERVERPENFSAQLHYALRRFPVAVVLGGFFGEVWPALPVLSGVLAYTANVPESAVRFSWVQEGEMTFGAQYEVGGMTVYAVPDDPALAPHMLRYIGNALGPQAPPGHYSQSTQPPPAKKPKRKGMQVLATIVMVAAGLAALGSGGWLANYALEGNRAHSLNDSVADRFHQDREMEVPGDETGPPQMLGRFESLFAENDELIGWMSIPAIGVDLPVMRGRDNEFYLYHDFNMRPSRFGTLFIDTSNSITPGEVSRNLSVFGHTTRDGSMFGRLHHFRRIDFYRENPTFRFSTLYEELEWVIFALFITNADPRQDNGNFFEWRGTDLYEEEDMDYLLQGIMERSMINTGIDVGYGDRLMSLTACTYEFRDARLVVFAREIRPGEEIDVSGAVTNRNFRRPAAWR